MKIEEHIVVVIAALGLQAIIFAVYIVF